MKLKSMVGILLVGMATIGVKASTIAPQFSNDGTDHWYYIVFSMGDAVAADQGEGKTVQTKSIKGGTEAQEWKFVGDETGFTMQSRTGNYAYLKGTMCTTSDATQASLFRVVKTSNTNYPEDCELEVLNKGDDYAFVNQSGGTGSGRSLIFYTSGENNNVLRFFSEEEIPVITDLTKLKEYTVTGSTSYLPEHRHTLWYTKPVTSETASTDPWMEYALPIGNGEFGAMIYGGIHQDHVQFNDKSLWTGSSTIRGCYQNFGDLYIEDISGVFDTEGVQDYCRTLDMTEAKATASYKSASGVSYTREYIASNPDKVVAMKLNSTTPGGISIRISLINGIKTGFIRPQYSEGSVSFAGKLDVVDFKAKVKAIPTGGVMSCTEDYIEITGADNVVILLAGATNFDEHSLTYISDAEAMRSDVDSRISKAEAKGWDSILADHVADFQSFSDRSELLLDGAAHETNITSLVNYYNGRTVVEDSPRSLMLEELYYTVGRYLMISSSRGMDLPTNLQGIWNNSSKPSWECDIHSNINVEMNYWPAEITNLSELHMPYLNYIKSMALDHSEWQQYARESGQTQGWTCYTQNNIFGHSNYAENYVIANAWYSTHLWQHYVYTLDKEYLQQTALPVMVSCCRFWMERLVKDSDGTWVAPQEWSPEHGPSAEDGTAHAQQLVSELFKNTLDALAVLGDTSGVETSFATELQEKYDNLDKGLAKETYTGAWGTTLNDVTSGDEILREWKSSDYSVGEDGHRHQSHLMAMYPFSQITPESEWFTPAVNSLKLRGDLSTGWSLGWRLCLWARALDGDHGHKIIRTALRHASSYGQSNGAGGIYYNLLDSHAPFQIDGNFGYTAGVTEMLMQSYQGVIRFLPALPSVWQGGSIRGLKAEGNFEVDERWTEGVLQHAEVLSVSGTECKLHYAGISEATIVDSEGSEVAVTKVDSDNVTFATEAGKRYLIDLGSGSGVQEVSQGGMLLNIEGGVAKVNVENATISAYSVSGVKLAESHKSTLDLREYAETMLVIKAVSNGETKQCKVFVKAK